MYKQIQNHSTITTLYQSKLLSEKVLTEDTISRIRNDFDRTLLSTLGESERNPLLWDDSTEQKWWPFWANHGHGPENQRDIPTSTGVSIDDLKVYGSSIFSIPSGFGAHEKVAAIMKNRLRAMETGTRLDWCTAETLAFGSLLAEGIDVRLSGQDSERGTFNQVGH